MRVSVIIPALNEERYLPTLLACLSRQTMAPVEIIVADGGSEDRTREIALAAGCLVVDGGLPAQGRNRGAKSATGDMLFFFDSDVWIADDFIERVVNDALARGAGSGTVYNFPFYQPWEKGFSSRFIRMQDWFFYFFHNIGHAISSLLRFSTATGTFMFSRPEVFRSINGFDESLVAFEDAHFALRACRVSRFVVLRQPQVGVSTRRFDLRNRTSFPLYMGIRGTFGRVLLGEKRTGRYF
ncbi:MAG: glycosyltransferase [Alcanivoracaceae bacterium]|jgi:glycosyltransferase involved in cell wall biosynthesis|nr:glycosyltransferase [Alcanivoracaceae bacterium]